VKKLTYQKKIFLIVILITLSLPGCLSWKVGWQQPAAPAGQGNVVALLDKAKSQANQADSRDKVLEAIKTYEHVLKIDPENYEALVNLGSYYFLVGYGYTDNRGEKKKYYMEAIKCCEKALYTNSDFKARVDKGEGVWDAAGVLSKREMQALYFWYLSVGNTWNDCLNGVEKMFAFHWAGRAKKILPVMMNIDPEWYGGSPYFSYAAYYAVLPSILGGDLKKAEDYFNKAITVGPNKLNFVTGRARYLHTKKGDRAAFEKDLKWVLEQPEQQPGDDYPWRVYQQNDARRMLANIDEYF